MGKKWKRLYQSHGFVKPNPIKVNENLDNHGFESSNDQKRCLEALIRFGVPCLKCSAYYLKEWKDKESF